jgi:ribose transport system substrate-binding protein
MGFGASVLLRKAYAMSRFLALCFCVCAALALAACDDGGSSSSTTRPAEGGRRVAVIPKGTTHVFWKTVEAGARKAADEMGVQMIWKGPLREDDRAEQIKVVEQFVSEGVDGICLAPLDTDALARPVASAMGRNIPVVIFDSSLKGQPGKDFASYVATNNIRGGEMAGEQLAKLLGGKGSIVLLRYNIGSGSTTEREEGFLKTVKAAGLTMLVENRYGGATVASAQGEAMKLVDQLKNADGVFAPNESSTLGLLAALRSNNLAGKVKFVGFDATPPLIEALQKGEIHALVAQDPQRMGYLAVQTVVKQLNGEEVDAIIDTGVRLITVESLKDPEVRKFLNLE